MTAARDSSNSKIVRHFADFAWSVTRKVSSLRSVSLKKTALVACSDDYIVARWWTKVTNWGDALNPVIIQKLSGKPVVHVKAIANIRNKPVFSVIGSTLQSASDPNLVVWGSGFISADGEFARPPRAIYAVRGPLTHDSISRQGIRCPDVYGDPALLYPRFYRPSVIQRYKLGVVPHYKDRGNSILERLRDQDGVHIIDITDPVDEVVNQICSCEVIASTSLHGIIAADAYGIPSIWTEVSSRVAGHGFKFRDYFSSVRREVLGPFHVNRATSVQEILDWCRPYSIDINLDRLVANCPFQRNV